MEPRPTILVVDDVPMFRELESLFLAGLGRVLTAATGEAALETIADERPDVVVLDADLPDMSGIELCRALRSDPELLGMHVVVVTARGASEDHARAVRAGAEDVLSKPLSREALVGAVARFAGFIEPRGLARVTLAEPVRLRGADHESWGTIRNLSRGGLFIESDCSPPARGELEAEFRLPETGERLRRTVQVVWRRVGQHGAPGGLGVRFVDLDGEDARALRHWVHERACPIPATPPSARTALPAA